MRWCRVEKTRQKEATRKEMEKLKAEIKARQLALQVGAQRT